MTRAKEHLTLTNARQRMLYGRTAANRPSRFLEEIPEENMHWLSKPEPPLRPGRPVGGCGPRCRRGTDRPDRAPAPGLVPAPPAFTPAAVPGKTAASTPIGRAAPPPPDGSWLPPGPPWPPRRCWTCGRETWCHAAFGKGMVLSVRPMGGDALVEVAFDNMGTKKLMLKSAGKHMEKL